MHSFTFIKLSYLEMLFNILLVDLYDDVGIFIHFLMRLGNNKSFFSLASQYQEFNRLFLGSLGFTVISNHLSTLWNLTFGSENVFGFFRVVKVVQIDSNNILPIISPLISSLRFFEIPLTLFGFSNHDED